MSAQKELKYFENVITCGKLLGILTQMLKDHVSIIIFFSYTKNTKLISLKLVLRKNSRFSLTFFCLFLL